MVSFQSTCHKQYTCAIWKPSLFSGKKVMGKDLRLKFLSHMPTSTLFPFSHSSEKGFFGISSWKSRGKIWNFHNILISILPKHQSIYYRGWKRHVSDFDEICTRCALWCKNLKTSVKILVLISGCHGDGLRDFGHFGVIWPWKCMKNAVNLHVENFFCVQYWGNLI